MIALFAGHYGALGYSPYAANLISQSDVVRHDPARLADAILRLIL